MLKKYFLFSMCFLLACGGGSHHDENNSSAEGSCAWLGMTQRVVNGATCNDDRSPVVRVINSYGNEGLFCSGVLIDESTVLTAAHCLQGPTRTIKVSYGKAKLTQSVDAVQWFAHPKFLGYGSENDVGIIKLSKSISGWPTVPLLFSRTAQAGETGTIFGYGTTGSKKDTDTDILRAGYAHVTQANESLIYMLYTYDSNTCTGDSGGPLVLIQDGVAAVAGITSSGSVSGCGYGDNSYFAALQDPDVQRFIKAHATNARYL